MTEKDTQLPDLKQPSGKDLTELENSQEFLDALKIPNTSERISESIFDLYKLEMLRHPLLTREEEIFHAKTYTFAKQAVEEERTKEVPDFQRYKEAYEKEKTAKDALILGNIRLVVHVAKKYTGRAELTDLISVGNLALYKAIEKFDYKKGEKIRFASYAYWWINRDIRLASFDQTEDIHIGNYNHERIKQIEKVSSIFYDHYNRQPSIEEIYAELPDIRPEEIKLLQRTAATRKVSLDATLQDADDTPTFHEIIADETSVVEDMPLHKALRNLLRSAINRCLDEQERRVILKRFDGNHTNNRKNGLKSSAQVGTELGVTFQRVNQIESSALNKLLHFLISDPDSMELVESFCDGANLRAQHIKRIIENITPQEVFMHNSPYKYFSPQNLLNHFGTETE